MIPLTKNCLARSFKAAVAGLSLILFANCGLVPGEESEDTDPSNVSSYEVRFYLPSGGAELSLLEQAVTVDVIRFKPDSNNSDSGEMIKAGQESVDVNGSFVDVKTEVDEVLVMEAKAGNGKVVASTVVPSLDSPPSTKDPLNVFAAESPVVGKAFMNAPFWHIAANIDNIVGQTSEDDFDPQSFREMAFKFNETFSTIDEDIVKELIRIQLGADDSPGQVSAAENTEDMKLRRKLVNINRKDYSMSNLGDKITEQQRDILKGNYGNLDFVPPLYRDGQIEKFTSDELMRRSSVDSDPETMTPEQLQKIRQTRYRVKAVLQNPKGPIDLETFMEKLGSLNVPEGDQSFSEEQIENLFNPSQPP